MNYDPSPCFSGSRDWRRLVFELLGYPRKQISEIKKLRQELTIVSSKTSGLQNQVGRMNQKRGISNLKRRFSS